MTTVTARRRVRQGNFVELPKLASGEFGYAKDQKRLFIGNDPITQSGDGITTEFNFGVDLDDLPGTYIVEVDGIAQTHTVDYNVNNELVIFLTAPADGAVVGFYHNLEILSTEPPESIYDTVKSESMIAPATTQDFQYITIYTTATGGYNYDDVEIRYTLVEGSNRRKGTLSIALNDDNTFTINDSYTSNCFGAALDHVFSGTMTGGVFVLNYTTTDSAPATMSWVAENFNAIE